MNTNVSTPQNILAKTNSLDRVYTYIHTYMEKRTKKENIISTNTNVIFYDESDLTELKEIAFRNKTNVSSIISNLVREFNLLFKSETPQRTLFNFDEDETILDFYHDAPTWENYIRGLSPEEKMKFKNQLIMIDKKLSKYY